MNRVGRTPGGPPGPRPTPSSALVDARKKPARGPAADQGVRPTRGPNSEMVAPARCARIH